MKKNPIWRRRNNEFYTLLQEIDIIQKMKMLQLQDEQGEDVVIL